MLSVDASNLLEEPPKKKFKPKFPDIPVLSDYKGEVSDGEFWKHWPRNKRKVGKSKLNADRLRELALEAGWRDIDTLDKVYADLKYGASIGCRGKYRGESFSSNAQSAYQNGDRVTDAVAEWIKEGYAGGPFEEKDVPKDRKINGIMTKEKPNGSVRVILNMSAPKGMSANEGIDCNEFPAKMSSTREWLRVLKKAGRNCLMCKVDWSAAYKQIAVHPDDLRLQWFQWLGKFFCELALIFGSKSSVGIFDRCAKIVLFIVLWKSGFPPSFVIQFLDDVAGAAPAGTDMLFTFDNAYNWVAEQLGFALAPRDSPDKSFGPQTSGTVLGVTYDTKQWVWWIPEEKQTRMLHIIKELIGLEEAPQRMVRSIAGKIINVKDLVPGGRFYLDCILKANRFSEDGAQMVPLTKEFKEQIWWWSVQLQACHKRMEIPDPDQKLPAWALNAYPDAAGGSLLPGRGCGVVLGSWWGHILWGHRINKDYKDEQGKLLGSKLSMLELIGPLHLVSSAWHLIRGQEVKFHVDNIGSVEIWSKGYSTHCVLSTTLVRAISHVAAAFDCRVDIVKVLRCSNVGASMADALSKSDFVRFQARARDAGMQMNEEPGEVARPLMDWIEDPKEDRYLGDKICKYLLTKTQVLGYNC